MAKAKTIFICQSCGYQAPKWLGRCPDCQGWGTLVEELVGEETPTEGVRQRWGTEESPRAIGDVADEEEGSRLPTRLEEFNRVLGGGIVAGSVVLLGGDPGIGKSTLMFQCLHTLAAQGKRCLYISAEESLRQTKLRAKRLGAMSAELFVAAETSLERIIQEVEELSPQVLVIDSIQSIYTSQLGSAPGSISQVRETSGRLTYLAKGLGVATFLVGHVTKDGAIAGPRVLEHIVDTVLYMERSADSPFRILRAVKNRFGSTNEIGVFEDFEFFFRSLHENRQKAFQQGIDKIRRRMVLIQASPHEGLGFIRPRSHKALDLANPVFRQPHIGNLFGLPTGHVLAPIFLSDSLTAARSGPVSPGYSG